jgi:peptide/nickel transport system substrate-binding protein
MGEIPPIDAARLESDPDFQLLKVAIPGESLLVFLNITKSPTADLQVRRALLYATDRQAIVDAVFLGYSPPAYGPLSRPTYAYSSLVETLYPYDPEQAEQLLAEAGWTDRDGDGIREKDNSPLVLETFLMGWGFLPEIGQILQQQLLQVGVQLNIQMQAAYPMFLQAASEGQHHLIPFTFSSSDPHILYSSFHSANVGGGFNWSKIQDADLDALLDQGKQELDEQKRAEIYAAVQERVMALALVLPIRDYVNLNGASSRVQGLRYDAQGWFPWLHDVRVE